jgi:UDP-N-acetylglucosamine--N-acetylmuramyl-(pentapeptide) pyrophosphoryl-undecaprenol N-acetylglucosamine transferase
MKVLIGGGGTGGHVFPAIAIAQALKRADESIEILFVGALGKIEMEKVPAAGFKIIGLPSAGIQRKQIWKNIALPFKLLKCMSMSKKIINDFQPDIAVGVGGYASGPILKAASKFGVPVVLQEQNSHAGVTNKLLAKKAVRIFTAYQNMEKYFDKDKIMLTGNPVRPDIVNNTATREEALEFFGLNPNKKTVLSIGGSLGAGTINESILSSVETIQKSDIQIIWQTGKYYYDNIERELKLKNCPDVHAMAFIKRMDLAYKAADVVISRSGALSVSELCIAAKPVIFVPSPNVAEDHQTKNAQALVSQDAALMLRDDEAKEKLLKLVLELCKNDEKQNLLKNNIKKLAISNSSDIIAHEIINLAKK